MSRKLVLTTIFIAVLIGMLGLSFNVQRVMAGGTIYIRADGSVDPSTVPIQRNGNTYIFIGNINDAVVVERDNIIIDGAGYTIQGAGSWAGIGLAGRSNVTIRNTIIKGFRYGINLDDSSHNSIFGNNITANQKDGISLESSSYNSIFSNSIIENDEDGTSLTSFSNHNNIYGNHLIENDFDGIVVGSSSYNKVYGNNITENDEDGIDLYESSYNSIFGNNITENWFDGIEIGYSSDHNNIYGNNIADNDEDGIDLYQSSNNSIFENIIIANWRHGIELYSSTNNSIFGNRVTGNYPGIYLVTSLNNTITRNNITRNYPGIHFRESSNNTLYHNNFVNNSRQVYDESWDHPEILSSVNFWDDGYPYGGNYWSDYTGLDSDYDGIGNSKHVLDLENTDNYPLMGMFSCFNASLGYSIDVISNSTIEDFEYFNETIKMYVSNITSDQRSSFCRLCIPHALMNVENLLPIVDDNFGEWAEFNNNVYDNGTHRWVYFTFEYPANKIEILPEFPSLLILPLFMIATLLAVIVYRRKYTT